MAETSVASELPLRRLEVVQSPESDIIIFLRRRLTQQQEGSHGHKDYSVSQGEKLHNCTPHKKAITGEKLMTGMPWQRMLRVAAILFTLLAVSNLLKPFHLWGEHTGFVLFGHRLSGTANAIVGPLFGVYQLVYALGCWRQKYFALPMAYAYAAYVIVNLALFVASQPPASGVGRMLPGLVYAVVAIGVSSGAAVLLTAYRASLT
jgi:hypothetical protein